MLTPTKTTKSLSAKSVVDVWKLVDARDRVIGRIATEIASLLIGKDVIFQSDNLNVGGVVVVINAAYVSATEKRQQTKEYTRYSGYPGGLTRQTLGVKLVDNPCEVLRHAVSRMLPKNKLRDRRLARLHIFADANHTFHQQFKI